MIHKKRGTRLVVDESLNLEQSLLGEKLKNQALTEKLTVSEDEKQETVKKLDNKELQLQRTKLNLKRTAARENYALKKIPKNRT